MAQEDNTRALKKFIAGQRDRQVRKQLADALRRVRERESEVETTEILRQKMKTQAMSDAELRELCHLCMASIRHVALSRHMLEQELRHNAIGSAGKRLLDELQHRHDNVTEYWCSRAIPWLHEGRRVQTTIPVRGSKPVAVECHQVPGTVLGAHFVRGYPAEDSPQGLTAARYLNLPGLAMTAVTDAADNVLYAGLRHQFPLAGELDLSRLKTAGAGETKALISAILNIVQKPGWNRQQDEQLVGESVEMFVTDDPYSNQLVRLLQSTAYRIAAEQAVAAALVSNPLDLGQVLDGKDRSIGIVSIALLTPEHVDTWFAQWSAFKDMEQSRAIVEVGVLDRSGKPRAVEVLLTMRRFVMFVEDDATGWDRCRDINRETAQQLLGPLHSPHLGGDIQAFIDHKKAIINRDSANIRKRLETQQRLLRAQGSWDRGAETLRKEAALLQASNDKWEARVCILRTAARQLKSLLTPAGDWTRNLAERRQAAARLALIGSCMDEVPMLSCAAGRNLVAPVESEVAFLAAVADSANGRLPKINLDLKRWRNARAAFEPPTPRAGSRDVPVNTMQEAGSGPVAVMKLSLAGSDSRCDKTHFEVDMSR